VTARFAFFLAGLFALASPAIAQSPRMEQQRLGDYVVEYPAARPALGPAVIQQLQTMPALPALPAAAPTFGRPVRIILAESDAHFNALTGNAIPEWGAGVADAENGIIVLPGYGGGRAAHSDMRRVLRHELAHIALHRYLEPARIPRWFNEGYARWAAGELDYGAEWRLRVAYALGKAPPLDSLELSWPRATTDAETAYLLSASVIAYLVRSSGVDALQSFLQRWDASNNMEQALASTYGLSVDQLETHWVRDVRKRYGWFAVLAQSAAFMTGASVLMLFLFAIRRRRDRRKRAMLQATELPDAPAFWEGGEVDESEPRQEN
jgi:hypothetical protein